jgi:hypothetical protein
MPASGAANELPVDSGPLGSFISESCRLSQFSRRSSL